MAYRGFGVWALVGQQLTNQMAVTLILWFTLKWRPHLIFSLKRVKQLFSFGWKLLASSLLDTIYKDLRSLVIGKIYTPSMLGYYNRGQQFPSLLITNINGTIQSVMLPVLASQQDNRSKVKGMMRRAIVTSSFFVFPAMVGLAIIAEPLVKILLTDKWLPSIPFIRIFCVSYTLMPIHTANLQAINAVGRSDIFLKLEIIKKILGVTILFMTISYGVYAIAIGGIFSGVIGSFINAYPNRQLLNYSYSEQLGDIMPSLLLSLVMGGVVYCINYTGLAPLSTLAIQVVIGIIVYIGLAYVFKIECLAYLSGTVKDLFLVKKKEVM